MLADGTKCQLNEWTGGV